MVDITSVVETNGAPIRSYHIEIDNGLGGPFVELQGFSANSLALQATKTLGVYPGLYYRFRYRAKNAIGWGEHSEISYVLSARTPDTPVPPTITLWMDTNIRIVFYLPFNGGSEISKAYIQIKTHDGLSYAEETVNCDGTNFAIFQSRQCIIPLNLLRAPVWSLVQGDSIMARVKFENEIGQSLFSGDTVVPVLMPYVPHQPSNGPRRINA